MVPRGHGTILFTGAIYLFLIYLVAGNGERSELKVAPFESLQSMSVWGPLVVSAPPSLPWLPS